MANLATKGGVEGNKLTIHSPLINMTKAQIIEAGIAHNVDYSLTVSCYQATENGAACGLCDSCRLRKQGFLEAGVEDPTRYKNSTWIYPCGEYYTHLLWGPLAQLVEQLAFNQLVPRSSRGRPTIFTILTSQLDIDLNSSKLVAT